MKLAILSNIIKIYISLNSYNSILSDEKSVIYASVFNRGFNSRPRAVGLPEVKVTDVPPHVFVEPMLKSLKSQVNKVLY